MAEGLREVVRPPLCGPLSRGGHYASGLGTIVAVAARLRHLHPCRGHRHRHGFLVPARRPRGRGSFGGEEATLLAVRHPERVLSLTLLDSYDNSPAAETFAASDSLPGPSLPSPPIAPVSLLDILWRQRMFGGWEDPASEVCATARFSPTGQYLGAVSPDSLSEVVAQGATRLSYSAVTQPVLALYAIIRGVKDLFPTIEALDSSSQSRAAALVAVVQREVSAARRTRLRRALPGARIVELPGASHAIFRSHPERVYLAMRAFLSDVQVRH
jgi:pimeloyl-ACP methyl ester carboxylesterase